MGVELELELELLSWLVGRHLRLRPASPSAPRAVPVASADAAEIAPADDDLGAPPADAAEIVPADDDLGADELDVVVVRREAGGLRITCRQMDLAGLDGMPVVAELGTGRQLVRLSGIVEVLEVLEARKVPVVARFKPAGPPEQLQRRQWMRVSAAVSVQVRLTGRHDGAGTDGRALPTSAGPRRPRGPELDGTVTSLSGSRPSVVLSGARPSTVTAVDISGGGLRLSGLPALERGTRLLLGLELDGAAVEVEGEVLGCLSDGTVRVAFVGASEAASQRIVRHVYQVQLQRRRLVTGGR